MVGAMGFTMLSDMFGRKPVFLFSQWAMVVVGKKIILSHCLGLPKSYATHLNGLFLQLWWVSCYIYFFHISGAATAFANNYYLFVTLRFFAGALQQVSPIAEFLWCNSVQAYCYCLYSVSNQITRQIPVVNPIVFARVSSLLVSWWLVSCFRPNTERLLARPSRISGRWACVCSPCLATVYETGDTSKWLYHYLAF